MVAEWASVWQTKEARARLSGPGISGGMTFVGLEQKKVQSDEEHVGGLHRIQSAEHQRDQTLLGEAFEKQVTGQPTILNTYPKLIVLTINKLGKYREANCPEYIDYSWSV